MSSDATSLPAVEHAVLTADLLLRLLVPFALGTLFTLAITAVNHRRDHIKHVRDVLSSAIQDISQKGARFWAKEYDAEALVQLRGAIVFMQHILPYSIESAQVDQKSATYMQDLFGNISHEALHSDEDLNSDSHVVDVEKVARLSVYCARAEALTNSMLLSRMSLAAILKTTVQSYFSKLAAFLKKIHNILCVP